MLMFLLCLMPCLLAFYCCSVKDKKVIPVLFIGMMTAVFYCLIRVMLFYSHRLIPDSLVSNYIYYLLRYSIIPIFVIYGLYLVLFRDSWEFKLSTFFPLMGAFYAIFIPYKVVAFTASVYSGYDVLIRPVVYAAMVGQIAISLRMIYKGLSEKKIFSLIISILLILVYIAIPALLDSMFVLNMNILIIGGIAAVYAIIPFILSILLLVKSKKSISA